MSRDASVRGRFGIVVVAALVGIVALTLWLSSGARDAPPAPAPLSAGFEVAGAPRLDADERDGGHTLARHVGRSEAQLRARLQREPSISAASSFSDRANAERAVAGALAQETSRVASWVARRDRRDLALDFRGVAARPVGTVLPRGAPAPLPASDARVVLRRKGDGYFVLTAYPLQEYR